MYVNLHIINIGLYAVRSFESQLIYTIFFYEVLVSLPSGVGKRSGVGAGDVGTSSSTIATAAVATSSVTTTAATAASTTSASPASSATSATAHLLQLGVDMLLGLSQDDEKVSGLLSVVLGEVGVSGTLGAGSTSSTDSVDIVLGVGGVVVVDNEVDTLDI